MGDSSFGVKILPAAILRNLLQQYPSGGQFFLEALQNADDTGRASKFRALLDLRRHATSKVRAPEARKLLQGEAILFYDDAGFQERDWRSMQFMCDSEKRKSPHETGSFGMGSRSFFHITDVLQVLSGNKLAWLDPDDILGSGHFGEQVSITEDKFFETCPDEAAPFHGVFGCDMSAPMQGTLIRASLRTAERAKTCSFMPQEFDLARAERIFQEFEEMLKNGEVLLFLTAVSVVELWRWDADAREPVVTAQCQVGVSSGHKLSKPVGPPKACRHFLQQFETFEELFAVLQKPDAAGSAPSVLDIITTEVNLKHDADSDKHCIRTSWLRYGYFLTDKETLRLGTSIECVPMVTLAVPLEKPTEGRAFTALPLPLPTQLPVHINAFFKLHANRRGMWRMSPDLDGEHCLWAEWNERILTVLAPQIYAEALEMLATTEDLTSDRGFSAWPRHDLVGREFGVLLAPLVKSLSSRPVLPAHDGTVVRPENAVYFTTPTVALAELRTVLLSLCSKRGHTVVDPPDHVVQLLQKHGALRMKDCKWVLLDVVLPMAADLEQSQRAAILLTFLEWAGSWQHDDILELGKQLQKLSWLETKSGRLLTISEAFDPEGSPESLGVVIEKRVALKDIIASNKLDGAVVWRMLRNYGLKTEITWEDAVEEASAIVESADLDRATRLYRHIAQNHVQFQGDRKASLEKLRTLPWVPAKEPSKDIKDEGVAKLMPLNEVFAPSARNLIWSVAPCICVDIEPTLIELKPGRSIDKEPELLIRQLKVLVDLASQTGMEPPCISNATLELFKAVFAEILKHLDKLPKLKEMEALVDLPLIPCQAVDSAQWDVALFTPGRAAFEAQHTHKALYPAIGIVMPGDFSIRMLAEAVGVPRAPSAEVLAEALCRLNIQQPNIDLAVTLSLELATRVRAGEELPAKVMIPSAQGVMDLSERVYIDDAAWTQGEVAMLHPRISPSDGRLLGCTSAREEMAKQCEEAIDAGELDEEAQAFGQEADLVAQVKQLLQEYGDSADLVKEFIQNSDDAGSQSLTFIVQEEQYGTTEIVDLRTASLQGPALYICSGKPLSPQDIANMQRVGHSKKRMDFFSSGRFGVGLNVMYRYCDCPQLLANGFLHFFDLTQKYVAKRKGKRGRKFSAEKFKGMFPHSWAPFEGGIAAKYPTVFRLPLRSSSSDLGLKVSVEHVRKELINAAMLGEKMLLFTRNLTNLQFYNGTKLVAAYEAAVKDLQAHDDFFAELPPTPLDLKPGAHRQHLVEKFITVQRAGKEKFDGKWAIQHRIGVTDKDMYKVLKEQLEKPHGVALLPHAACAVRIEPFDPDKRSGRICAGPPTIFRTNSCCWIHGGFSLLSSRKALPLPEEGEAAPGLDKAWNKMLLEGVIAEAMHTLILHCCTLVMWHGLKIEHFWELFPLRGDRLQSILAAAVFRVALKSAIYPVENDGKVFWAQGPTPSFFADELPKDLQQALVVDGLKLVTLPKELLIEYETALGKPRIKCDPLELGRFLEEGWRRRHKDVSVELELDQVGMGCLKSKKWIVILLSFIARGLWKEHVTMCRKQGNFGLLHRFDLEPLRGMPLLLDSAGRVTAFGGKERSVKYSTWRDLLPSKQDIYVDRECHRAILDAVDTTLEGITQVVETNIPFIKPFSLEDLLPHKEIVEKTVHGNLSFADPENGTLRQFWSLVGEAALLENAEREEGRRRPTDKCWHEHIQDWSILPVCTVDGAGDEGEELHALHQGGICCAVALLDSDPAVQESLELIIQEVGIATVQAEMMRDERIATVLKPLVVSNNTDFLALLTEHGNIDALSGAQRHDLLAYFSVFTVKGGLDLTPVAQLPLFKTADLTSTFINLSQTLPHVCIDPSDKNATRLCKLLPPGLVLLAWPTTQVKPIYEHFGITLCSGEEFMANYIVPQLPEICRNAGSRGTSAFPFLDALHSYVIEDRSDRVRSMAMDMKFVPSLDLTWAGAPCEFLSLAGLAATAFEDVLGQHGYLPAKWIQESERHCELLCNLGMAEHLSASMILLCASHLDQTFGGEVIPADAAKGLELEDDVDDEKNAKQPMMAIDSKPATADDGEKAATGDEKEKAPDKAAPPADVDMAAPQSSAKALAPGDSTDEAKDEAEKLPNGSAQVQTTEEKQSSKQNGALVPKNSGDDKPQSKDGASGAASDRKRMRKVSEKMKKMSFALIEEFCRAAEELWPKAPKSVPAAAPEHLNLDDMTSLLEAASLRVLLARRLRSDADKLQEVEVRNKTEASSSSQQKRSPWKTEAVVLQHSELVLVPFEGTAFEGAAEVLWSICPLADHNNHAAPGMATALQNMLELHRMDMKNVFGALVLPEDAPPDQVLKQLAVLCSLQQTEHDVATVKPDSLLSEDLRACWSYLSDNADSLRGADVQDVLKSLRNLPCVAVASEDVADNPTNEILLTQPRYAFFHLPLLRGKEANMRLYMRQVDADGMKEAALFRALGVREKPSAADYATASERISIKAARLGGATFEWVIACLEACVKNFHDEVLHLHGQDVSIQVRNLHMVSLDGSVVCAEKLVWVDVPRWLSRCKQDKRLKFAALGGTQENRELAKSLVGSAGLRVLSDLVDERRLVEMGETLPSGSEKPALEDTQARRLLEEQDDAGTRAVKDRLERILRAFDFASGLHAVMVHSSDKMTMHRMEGLPLNEVRKELATIQLKCAAKRLRSALYFKDGGDFIAGSEADLQVYYDSSQRSIFVKGKQVDDDTFVQELVFALRRAVPFLWDVDGFLLEALMRVVLREGAAAVQGFLEKRDIKISNISSQSLGPGDLLPRELQDHLMWSMNASFGEGECAAVLVKDIFVIVEVAKWPDGKDLGSGLSKSYRVKLAPDKFDAKKHFEVYKIHGSSKSAKDTETDREKSNALEVISDKKDVVEEGGDEFSQDDLKAIHEVKSYLKEMGNLPTEEYRVVMRRLFKTWHPDKVGDTPVSNRIFRLLRKHEQWYKKRLAGESVGDDSWLDAEDNAGKSGNSKENSGEQVLLAIEDEKSESAANSGQQGSWFDEFETEMKLARSMQEQESGAYGKFTGVAPTAKGAALTQIEMQGGDQTVESYGVQPLKMSFVQDEAPGGPGRVVDKQQAPRWLQQGRLELLAAQKLLKPMEGMRPLCAAAVWHCEQAVEMAIKAAMFRTCGVSEDEAIGTSAHDITEFLRRVRNAAAFTEEQRRAQQVPVEEEEIEWLRRSYLAARYPKAWMYGLPSELYNTQDAERAIRIAEEILKWAAVIEDLPDPGVQKQDDDLQRILDQRKRRWSELVEEADNVNKGDYKRPAGGGVPAAVAPPPKAEAPLVNTPAPSAGLAALNARAKSMSAMNAAKSLSSLNAKPAKAASSSSSSVPVVVVKAAEASAASAAAPAPAPPPLKMAKLSERPPPAKEVESAAKPSEPQRPKAGSDPAKPKAPEPPTLRQSSAPSSAEAKKKAEPQKRTVLLSKGSAPAPAETERVAKVQKTEPAKTAGAAAPKKMSLAPTGAMPTKAATTSAPAVPSKAASEKPPAPEDKLAQLKARLLKSQMSRKP